tara:strand:- start:1373 stop:1726 length:354 start_codon:yes stop_codon:yes gene_type:complete
MSKKRKPSHGKLGGNLQDAHMRNVAGVKVRELNKPVELKVITKVPAKWMLKDLETDQTYIGTGKKKIGEQWREIGPKRHDWLQGRTKKQYSDSMMMVAFAALGLFVTMLVLTLIIQK